MKKIYKIIIIFIILLIVILFIKPQNWILKKIYKLDYMEFVEKYSEEYGVDKFLILAIIKNESNFKPNIDSHMGAIGLMQLMESTAMEISNEIHDEEIIKEELYDPEMNIKIGTKYFSYLVKHYNGNEALALAAYNAGMGNVDKWIEEGIIKENGSDLENIPYKETNNYVRKILRDYKIYINLWSKK